MTKLLILCSSFYTRKKAKQSKIKVSFGVNCEGQFDALIIGKLLLGSRSPQFSCRLCTTWDGGFAFKDLELTHKRITIQSAVVMTRGATQQIKDKAKVIRGNISILPFLWFQCTWLANEIHRSLFARWSHDEILVSFQRFAHTSFIILVITSQAYSWKIWTLKCIT